MCAVSTEHVQIASNATSFASFTFRDPVKRPMHGDHLHKLRTNVDEGKLVPRVLAAFSALEAVAVGAGLVVPDLDEEEDAEVLIDEPDVEVAPVGPVAGGAGTAVTA